MGMLEDLRVTQGLFEDDGADGRRQYLSLCHVGTVLNQLDPKSVPSRTLRRVHGCDSHRNCIGCDIGKQYAAALLETSTYTNGSPCVQVDHVEALVEAYAGTGTERKLIRACGPGARLHDAATLFGDVEGVQAVVQTLDDQFGCTRRNSCWSCAHGFDSLVDMLIDLSENGLDGEAGAYLRQGRHVRTL
jgi:hypothetical protein